MSDLLTLSDLKVFLGVGSSDTSQDALLTALLAEVQELLEIDCGRKLIPFATAASYVEVLDGTGTAHVFLGRPIATLTSITLGVDATAPIETLDVADPSVVGFTVGERQISRTDGGRFGVAGAPRFVHVTFGAADDVPVSARLAVKRGCALLYRQRGSEDARTESAPDYQRELALLRNDDVWQLACAGSDRMVLA